MELHNCPQGSPEWVALRAEPNTFTASEAPVMMGYGLTKKRNELLAEKHNGLAKEVSSFVEDRVFAPGHEAEAAFRPIAEEIIGDELFPCTGSIVVDGMRLLASFDGLTMDHKIGMEHKLRSQHIVDDILAVAPGLRPPAPVIDPVETVMAICNEWRASQGLQAGARDADVVAPERFPPIRFAHINPLPPTSRYAHKPSVRQELGRFVACEWGHTGKGLLVCTPPAIQPVLWTVAVLGGVATLAQARLARCRGAGNRRGDIPCWVQGADSAPPAGGHGDGSDGCPSDTP